jgi:hypothetical protein
MVTIKNNAEGIVQNIRRDSLEGVVLPNGWELKLLSTGGQRQFDTSAIIERYDSRIAMTVLADFIHMGHQSVGSFALSSNKTKVFSMAVGAYLDMICEVFNNKAIPQLIDMNGDHFSGITDYPYLDHGDVEDVDLAELGDFLQKAIGSGALTPDESIDDYVRQAAGLPERVDEWTPQERTAASTGGTTPANPTPSADDGATEKSRKPDDVAKEMKAIEEGILAAMAEHKGLHGEDAQDFIKSTQAKIRLGRDAP